MHRSRHWTPRSACIFRQVNPFKWNGFSFRGGNTIKIAFSSLLKGIYSKREYTALTNETFHVHCLPDRLSTWNVEISELNANSVDPDEMPQNHILWHLICIYTVCLCPFCGMLGLNGLREIFTLKIEIRNKNETLFQKLQNSKNCFTH